MTSALGRREHPSRAAGTQEKIPFLHTAVIPSGGDAGSRLPATALLRPCCSPLLLVAWWTGDARCLCDSLDEVTMPATTKMPSLSKKMLAGYV